MHADLQCFHATENTSRHDGVFGTVVLLRLPCRLRKKWREHRLDFARGTLRTLDPFSAALRNAHGQREVSPNRRFHSTSPAHRGTLSHERRARHPTRTQGTSVSGRGHSPVLPLQPPRPGSDPRMQVAVPSLWAPLPTRRLFGLRGSCHKDCQASSATLKFRRSDSAFQAILRRSRFGRMLGPYIPWAAVPRGTASHRARLFQ